MAKKILKNRTQFTSTLRNDLLERLKEQSTMTSVPISRLLDRAVEQCLGKKEER